MKMSLTYVPENLPPPKYGRSHVCAHDGAARTHLYRIVFIVLEVEVMGDRNTM